MRKNGLFCWLILLCWNSLCLNISYCVPSHEKLSTVSVNFQHFVLLCYFYYLYFYSCYILRCLAGPAWMCPSPSMEEMRRLRRSCRASLYNGMPLEGVAKLTDFMKSFMDENRKWLKMIERYLNIFEESVAHSPCWPNMAQRRVSSWALGPNFGSIWLQSLFWSLSGSCCPCRPGPGGFPRL